MRSLAREAHAKFAALLLLLLLLRLRLRLLLLVFLFYQLSYELWQKFVNACEP